MAVVLETSIRRYIGDTADTKPTGVPVGSTYLDRQTNILYITYDGTNWVARNTIMKLAANSGVDIGDVDVTSIAAGDNNIGNVDLASAIPAGTNNIGDVDEAPIACAAADVNLPAAATAAVVTYAANATNKHVITGIAWSYAGGIPVGGNLKVEDVSGTTVFSMDISEEGAGFIVFPKPKKSAAVNTAMIITLASGGAGVTGKVSILNHFTEA